MQAPYKFSIIVGPLLYAPTFAGLISGLWRVTDGVTGF